MLELPNYHVAIVLILYCWKSAAKVSSLLLLN